MLDIKFVKENIDVVYENMRRKNRKDLGIVNEVVALDAEWRKLKYEEDSLRSERNKVSEAISAKKKKKENADAEMKRAKEIPGKIDAIGEKRKELEGKILKLQMKLPNIMSGKVPLGKSDAENVEERRVGSPKKFSAGPQPRCCALNSSASSGRR